MSKLFFSTIALILLAWPSASRAKVIMYIYQNGGDVIASGSGTLDTTDLTSKSSGATSAEIDGYSGIVTIGPASYQRYVGYGGLSGPSSFGTSDTDINADSGSGDTFGVQDRSLYLLTPGNYI